jgi:hypothetical protein
MQLAKTTITGRIVLTGATMLGTAGAALPAQAQTMDVTVTVPRLNVAEYHKPYVAMWLEGAGGPKTIAVWYDFDMKNGEGTKWLRDIRTWWRLSGRTLRFPADGVSGATRPAGAQRVSFAQGRGPLGTLAPGQYTLVVEAAREAGGRELVRVPFAWPPRPGQTASATGNAELGAVSITFGR